ncbi:DUF2267 domain-containing protein [Halohasta salina]|uniref:DUF2267 domain-containing protein n=1 Tax=Halohasta salina TaxID=2961621 RepID=UPI0020A37603|nr:DUF2267 domain-containing protein [Halohasta salina]
MNYKAFMGQVQHRLELNELGPAVRATRAVLTTVGERIDPGEATDLASPLPMEVDRYLIAGSEQAGGEKFTYDEFLDRISERAGVDRSDANYYAETVVGLVSEIVPAGNVQKVRDQLPEGFESLFQFVDEPHPLARGE